MNPKYVKFALSEESLPYFKQCFDNYGKVKDLNLLRWQFSEPSGGFSNTIVIVDKETDTGVGVCASVSNPFKLLDEEVTGTQALDLLVDRNHRKSGILREIIRSMTSEAIAKHRRLVYSFPNKRSVSIAERFLGWKVLGPAPFLIKPLKTGYFSKRLNHLKFLPNINIPIVSLNSSKNITITDEKEFPVEVDKIWEIFSQNVEVALQRDQKYLNWRYLEKPDQYYKILHARDKDGKYLGYIVYTIKKKHRGTVAYIMELVYDTSRSRAGKLLLDKAVSNVKRSGADFILAWCLDHSPNFSIFRRKFFLKLPVRLRPIEINFATHAFSKTKEDKDVIENLDSWYLSYSDSDTV